MMPLDATDAMSRHVIDTYAISLRLRRYEQSGHARLRWLLLRYARYYATARRRLPLITPRTYVSIELRLLPLLYADGQDDELFCRLSHAMRRYAA